MSTIPDELEHDDEYLTDPTERAKYFGASHTAVLFDDHPFQTAAEYWLDKRDGTSQPETQPMVRGRMLEDAIAQWYCHDVGVKVQPGRTTTRGHLVCVPDRELHGSSGLVSIKTTLRRDEGAQKYWIWQAQAEMFITGARRNIIVWLDGNQELQTHTELADTDIGLAIWQKSAEFMASLASGQMPEWIERSARDITRQYRELGDATEVDSLGLQLVSDYAVMKAEAKRYEDAAQELRDQIFRLAEDAPALMWQGTVIARLELRKGASRFDTRKFTADHPDIAEQYTTTGEPTRALTIPKGTVAND
jgi:predicted phage-related endonuclease